MRGYHKAVNDESTNDDAKKDEYPPDTQFGRAAAEDAERAEKQDEASTHDEVRAGNKAEPAEDDDLVDEQSRESFPASDPPSNR